DRGIRIQNSYMTYRRRYRTRMDPIAVVDLLVFDESNPRSVAHQLIRLEDLTRGLPEWKEAGKSAESRIALHALSLMRLADGAVRSADDDYRELQSLLSQEKNYLRTLAETISLHYFSYIETQQTLEANQWSVTG
ncbi:MAG TPA: alpha-E domain-containing protein, partial [Leptospiraceae bacterium]|nr:alpha-E domain-containing protein [Leptospiraceae bacterium]